MAENLHRDPFEEFLKKTLSEHEERAPADLWPRIENALAAPKSGSRRLWPGRKGWWAAAAVAVAAVLAWQLARYAHRIEQLEQALRQQQDTIALMRRQWRASLHHEPTRPRYEGAPEGLAESATRLSANATRTAPPSSGPAHPVPADHTAQAHKPASPISSAQSPADEGLQNQAAGKKPPPEPPAHEANKHDRPSRAISPVAVPAGSMRLQPLTARAWQPRPAMQPPLASPLRAPLSGQSIAAEWTLLHSTRVLKSIKGEPPGQTRTFYDSTALRITETITGPRWEKALGGRWHLHTGLSLRQATYELRHAPEFSFGEGVPYDPVPHHGNGPAGNPHEKAFFFNINAATGPLSFRLAVTPRDTLQPIAPDEKIGLDIRIRQRARYLTLPIALQYRLPLGRFQIACRAGLMANALANAQATVLEMQSRHPLFEPDREAFELTQPYARDLYFEWLAALQIEYLPARRWRIALGPTAAGLLTPPHRAAYMRTRGSSVGWTAAVQRIF